MTLPTVVGAGGGGFLMNALSATIVEPASRNKTTNTLMNNHFQPLRGRAGGNDDGGGGVHAFDDERNGAAVCALCAGGSGEERTGLLLAGVAGEPTSRAGKAVN